MAVDVAEPDAGSVRGVFRREPPVDQVFRPELEVMTELFRHLGFYVGAVTKAAPQRAEPRDDTGDPHGQISCGVAVRTAAIASTNRCQFASCSPSCRRPARVRR